MCGIAGAFGPSPLSDVRINAALGSMRSLPCIDLM